MLHQVLLTESAHADLQTLHRYVAESDGTIAADRILDRLSSVAETLAQFPERGSHPQELLALGNREFRQLIVTPWRLIYRVIGRRVYVLMIVDERRDMRTLLARRLLSGGNQG